MPETTRLGDMASNPADKHGCPVEPHPTIGPAVQGYANVLTNNRPTMRVGDMGIHAVYCGPNTWKAAAGSSAVFANGKKIVRKGDKSSHCGGDGTVKMGSSNVFVGSGQAKAMKEARKSEAPCVLK